MAEVAIRDVTKSYGATQVLHGVSIDIRDGQFVVLVGPSGCGKSTLLRMIAGLESVTGGDIAIGGRTVNNLSPARRDIAMVFQSYALYPHKTVEQNMGFALKLKKIDPKVVAEKVRSAADILELTPLLKRYPRQLSGGQRQRVAMGRAIVRDPRVFLFDEPLSNLDAQLRVQMRTEIKELHQRLKTTTIYVTHDQIEAMTMADKIVLMHAGKIMQIGTPDEVYERPNSKYVADFIGSPSMNFFEGTVEAAGVPRFVAEGISIDLSPGVGAKAGQKVILGVRPNDLGISDAGGIKGQVVLCETTGADMQVHARVGTFETVAVVPRGERRAPGSPVSLSVQPDKVHLFDAATEQRIG